MQLWTKSLAHSAFRHTRKGENDTGRIVLHTARRATIAAATLPPCVWISHTSSRV